MAEVTFLDCVWKIRENWWSTVWSLGSGRPSSHWLPPTSSSQPNAELEHEKWFVFTGADNLFPSPIFFATLHSRASFIQELGAFYSVLGSIRPLTLILNCFLKMPLLKKKNLQKFIQQLLSGTGKGLKNLTRKQSEKWRSK